jgi:hypothetical protein
VLVRLLTHDGIMREYRCWSDYGLDTDEGVLDKAWRFGRVSEQWPSMTAKTLRGYVVTRQTFSDDEMTFDVIYVRPPGHQDITE